MIIGVTISLSDASYTLTRLVRKHLIMLYFTVSLSNHRYIKTKHVQRMEISSCFFILSEILQFIAKYLAPLLDIYVYIHIGICSFDVNLLCKQQIF
jgi:adenylosuccinate lyase